MIGNCAPHQIAPIFGLGAEISAFSWTSDQNGHLTAKQEIHNNNKRPIK
jgi:hypothetical protein